LWSATVIPLQQLRITRFAKGMVAVHRQIQGRLDGRAGALRPRPPRTGEAALDEDPASVLKLLEAVGAGDPAEIYRCAVEKDVSELIARSRRLPGDLDLAPDVADAILAEALAAAEARVGQKDRRKPS